ncbi:hypothetical protein HU230_0008030 [Bradyrhizobium quebecense]|uniref:Uncharacterized protein n=1 Tax=Bradyrhizobium quebecense TaxID=2748629 RepID=A0A973WSU2_9BRAD|nr:hypothetical protein [Bradyrhizobium quebecense]UGA45975.1 hypothetical protein HU230_0008030 [Bradyrhizobium quebecense]
MKYAVARMQGSQARMFTGRYNDRSPVCAPITTGKPGSAKAYDDLDVAEVIAVIFNAMVKARAPKRRAVWTAIPLPERVSP